MVAFGEAPLDLFLRGLTFVCAVLDGVETRATHTAENLIAVFLRVGVTSINKTLGGPSSIAGMHLQACRLLGLTPASQLLDALGGLPPLGPTCEAS